MTSTPRNPTADRLSGAAAGRARGIFRRARRMTTATVTGARLPRSTRNLIARTALAGEDWQWWRLRDRLAMAGDIERTLRKNGLMADG